MRNQQLDDYMVQQIVSRLILPFEQWEAYRYGIIDRKGKVLRKKETLTKKQEKDAWTNLDVLCCNLKKLFMSFPQTQMKLNQLTNLQSAPIPTTIGQPPIYPMSMIKNFFLLKEDAPANSAGGGEVAGIGVGSAQFAEPPVRQSNMLSRLYRRTRSRRRLWTR